ncbi:MAG: TIGR03118 family protein, partial [Candidatus Udaeobacter sp.]
GGHHAIYKGATLGVAGGHNFLYATDFHNGQVDTFDENFHQVNPHGFVDSSLPAGYAPFGIRNFNNEIFVTYAKQDHKREDDVACPGCGFVNVFDTSGNFLRHLVSGGNLNAPWGLVEVENELWVGNFGDGLINVYDPMTGAFIETLMRTDGTTPLQFDGLWDMLPAQNGGVFFTAGIADEAHGLFGIITED